MRRLVPHLFPAHIANELPRARSEPIRAFNGRVTQSPKTRVSWGYPQASVRQSGSARLDFKHGQMTEISYKPSTSSYGHSISKFRWIGVTSA